MNIKQFAKRNWLWALYFAFVAIAITTRSDVSLFTSDGPYGTGKPVVWLIWILFLIYSLKVSMQENFFKSLGKMNSILWSRQVGLDLYLGLLFPLCLIYFNEGSLATMLIWLLAIFPFANLATLPYVALNYDSIIALLN